MSIQNNTTELQAILDAVNALPDAGEGGVNPTGTLEITTNGTHDVTNYASAEVNVPDVPAVTEELSVTENGEYTPDEGVDGFSKVTVNVPSEEPVLQEKTVTKNGEVTPDSGYDGLSKVVVEVPDVPAVVEPLEVTQNGTYTAPDGVDGFSSVEVAVPEEDLDAELTEQEAKIAELISVLEGKAAGSAVETCTLKIVTDTETSDVSITQVVYPVLNDGGSVIWERLDSGGTFSASTVEIENVVVGQCVIVAYNAFGGIDITTENAEFLLDEGSWLCAFLVRCTKANATSIVTIIGTEY